MITVEQAKLEAAQDLIDTCIRSPGSVPWAEVLDFIRQEELPDDVATSILIHCKMEGYA
jgi:hypothetical protein